MNPSFRSSTLGGLAALFLWSATFALARSLSEQVGPLTAGVAVYFAGGLLAAPVLVRRVRQWKASGEFSMRYFLGCGGLFVLYTALIYVAVGAAADRQQLLEVALVNYLWPAATLLLSVPLLRKRASLLLLPGSALALAGIALVMTQGAELSVGGFWARARANPPAYLCALIAAVAWALYSNLARRWSGPTGGVTLFVPVTGLVLLGIRCLADEQTSWTLRAACEAFALGAITVGAYALWDRAMQKGNFVLVASCSYFTPLLSTLVSCLYLQVMPQARLWSGCLLLICGTLLSWRAMRDTGN